jgi:integrase
VVKRGADTWSFRVEFPRENGKRRQQLFTIRGTKKQAEAERNRILHEVATGQFAVPSKLTVGEYLDHWFELMIEPKKASNTKRLFGSIIACHLKPRLGAVLLTKLTEYQVQRYFVTLGKEGRRDAKGGLSQKTLTLHHAVLSMAMRQAVRWRFITRSPADIPDPPQADTPEQKALTLEQSKTLLEKAVDTPLFGPVLFALLYGMRIGEVTGLRWADIDTAGGQVHVRQNLVWLGNVHEFTTPKGKRSRSYPLLDPVRLFLRHHQCGVSGLVFPGPDGGPWCGNQVRRGYYELLEKAQLPRIRFHDLRHSSSSLLLSAGIPLIVVSRWLGHRDATVTAQVYGHLLPGDLDRAGTEMERLFSTLSPGTKPVRKRVVVHRRCTKPGQEADFRHENGFGNLEGP